ARFTNTGTVLGRAGTLINLMGSYTVQIGAQYGQIIVDGVISLNGALHVNLIQGFMPHAGDQFTLIDNRGTNPIDGTFTGLPEGALVWAGTYGFTISYVGGPSNHVGGPGNDLVLTVTIANQPPTAQAGGPYTVVRGGTIQLDASGSADPDQAAGTL